jgi:hypothetical protein
VNLKLTSACVIGGVMALATPLQAFTGVAATAHPSSTSDGAGDNSNPYAIIIDRNIFRLNPPPPPKDTEKKPVDLPKVYLNGIIKIGDDVRVLFSIPPKDAKSQTTYFKLAPGEKDDVLELVRIHPDQQEVDVLVSGTAMTLSMLSNSLASAGGKAAGGAKASGPAAAPPGGSSAIIAGGGRNSSPYGSVTVGGGGGGGFTTIGGGNSTSFGGGGTSFGGGGTSFGGGGTSFGGGGTSFGGGVSVSGGSSAGTVGQQLTSALISGTQTPGQGSTVGTTGPVASPEVQAANLLLQYEQDQQSGKSGPPLPPSLAEMVGENTGSVPPTPGSSRRGASSGPPPPVP